MLAARTLLSVPGRSHERKIAHRPMGAPELRAPWANKSIYEGSSLGVLGIFRCNCSQAFALQFRRCTPYFRHDIPPVLVCPGRQYCSCAWHLRRICFGVELIVTAVLSVSGPFSMHICVSINFTAVLMMSQPFPLLFCWCPSHSAAALLVFLPLSVRFREFSQCSPQFSSCPNHFRYNSVDVPTNFAAVLFAS